MIDAQRVSPLQKRVLFLCFLVVAIDGFDTAIIGFIAPAIRGEWRLGVAQLGPPPATLGLVRRRELLGQLTCR